MFEAPEKTVLIINRTPQPSIKDDQKDSTGGQDKAVCGESHGTAAPAVATLLITD
jgi:hypothetical protein